MLGTLKNAMLVQASENVLQKVPQDRHPSLDRVLKAGRSIMFQSKNDMFKKQMLKSPDFAHNVGEGSAELLGLMFEQSKKTLPMDLGIAAVGILMFEALDFLEQAGKVKVTPGLIDDATMDMSSAIMQFLNVTPEQLQQMIAEKQGQQAPPTESTPPPQGILASGGA